MFYLCHYFQNVGTVSMYARNIFDCDKEIVTILIKNFNNQSYQL